MFYFLSSLVLFLFSREVLLNHSSVDHFININMLCPCHGVIGLVCTTFPNFSFKESLQQLSLPPPSPLSGVGMCWEHSKYLYKLLHRTRRELRDHCWHCSRSWGWIKIKLEWVDGGIDLISGCTDIVQCTVWLCCLATWLTWCNTSAKHWAILIL